MKPYETYNFDSYSEQPIDHGSIILHVDDHFIHGQKMTL